MFVYVYVLVYLCACMLFFKYTFCLRFKSSLFYWIRMPEADERRNCPPGGSEISPPLLVHCQQLTIPNGMSPSTDTAVGAIHMVVCDRGFNRTGPATRRCLPSGVWSGAVQQCQGKPWCRILRERERQRERKKERKRKRESQTLVYGSENQADKMSWSRLGSNPWPGFALRRSNH